MKAAAGPELDAIVSALTARARSPAVGLFGPDTVMWRVARENVLLAGGPRALLLQLAHPAVAAGVAQHSRVHADPLGRSLRTFHAMYTLTFGDLESALRVARAVWTRHVPVQGTVARETRSPAAGEPYRALDPELLAWVWATLHDTMLVSYSALVGPLSPADRARFYDEGKILQLAFGIPASRIAPTLADHEAYVARVLDGPTLDVSADARAQWELLVRGAPSSGVVGALMLRRGGALHRLLANRSARVLAPPFLRLLAAGTLPPRVRDGYGLSWPDAADPFLDALTGAVRRAVRHLPPRARYHPAYRAALQRLHPPKHDWAEAS